jgi:hypothetical protein
MNSSKTSTAGFTGFVIATLFLLGSWTLSCGYSVINGAFLSSSFTGLKTKGLRGAGSFECATGEGDTDSFFGFLLGVSLNSSFRGGRVADA